MLHRGFYFCGKSLDLNLLNRPIPPVRRFFFKLECVFLNFSAAKESNSRSKQKKNQNRAHSN